MSNFILNKLAIPPSVEFPSIPYITIEIPENLC